MCLRIWRQYLLWLQSSQPSCAFIPAPISFQLSESFLLLVLFFPQQSPQSSTLHLTKREACEFVILGIRAQANSGGIRRARFHLLWTASPALSVLQPGVTLTSGDHTSNAHTEVTQLQFWTRVGFFLPEQWLPCNETIFFKSVLHHKGQTGVCLPRLAPALVLHVGIITALLLLLSFVQHFSKYILRMIDKFIIRHVISRKPTYILCFTGTLITKTNSEQSCGPCRSDTVQLLAMLCHPWDFSLHSPSVALTPLKWTETRSPPRLIFVHLAKKSK